MTPTEVLHQELLEYRANGVTLDGICQNVPDEDEVLEKLMSRTFPLKAIFPISVRAEIDRNIQYCIVRGDAQAPYEPDDSFVHDYLCERWALLNYLINETGDL
jgi:hypothetical protein